MSARPLRWIGLVLLGFGAWQLAAGVGIEAKAWLGQMLIRDAWAKTIETGGRHAPWPWADTAPVARLEVPRHETDLIVLAGATGRTIAWGPGHQDGSAAPGTPGPSDIIDAWFLKPTKRSSTTSQP